MLLLKLFYDIRHRKCKLKKNNKKGRDMGSSLYFVTKIKPDKRTE